MDRATLDRWCEKAILGLTLTILVFGPLAAGAVGPFEFLVLQTLTLAVVVLWLARMWIQENYRLLWPPICWCVLAFAAYAIVRYQQADIEYAARTELIRILLYAFLFLAALNNLHRQESTQTVMFVLVFCGMAISLYAVYQFFTHTEYVWHLLAPELKPEQYLKRASGTFINPNNLAGFLEMLIPLGLAGALKGRHAPTTRIFLGYAALAMLAGIAVTISRGGWISAGAALAVLFAVLVCYRDSRLPAVIFLGLLLALAVVFFREGYRAQTRWQRLFREAGEVQDVRHYVAQAAVAMWKDHFWWGAGPAHFDYRFPQYRPEFVQLRPGRAHNDYLNTLVDWGVVGTVLVASAWVCLFIGVVRTWKFVQRAGDFVAKPSSRAAFVLGATAGLLALLVHSLTDFNVHIPANAILMVTLLALLTSHVRFATERYWVTLGWVTRLALTMVVLLGAGYLAREAAKNLRQQFLLSRADRIERATLKLGEIYDYFLKRAEGGTNDLQKLDLRVLGQLPPETQEAVRNQIEKLQRPSDTPPEVDLNVLDQIARQTQQLIRDQTEALQGAFAAESKNFETSYRVGDLLRRSSWQRGPGFETLAQEAMKWFEVGIRLNPYDAYNHFSYGMCLHLLKRRAEAGRYFERARELDPRSYYVTAHVGWHYFNLEDYAEAKRWFLESKRLSELVWRYNPIAWNYLRLIEQRETSPQP
jgi:O-antigen ligase